MKAITSTFYFYFYFNKLIQKIFYYFDINHHKLQSRNIKKFKRYTIFTIFKNSHHKLLSLLVICSRNIIIFKS